MSVAVSVARACGPPARVAAARASAGWRLCRDGADGGDGHRAWCRGVVGGVIRGDVLPAAPDAAGPAPAEGADGARMVVPAGERAGVVVGGPGVPVAGAVGERVERASQPLVARPPEAGDLAFQIERDGALAEASPAGARRGWGRRAGVAHLCEHRGRGDDAAGAAEQREEDGAVGMLAHGGGDLALELVDRSDDRFKRRDQREHRRAAGLALSAPGPALGRATELGQQFGRRLVAAVALARQRWRRCWPTTARRRGLG